MKRPQAVLLLPLLSLLFTGCDFNNVPSFLPETGRTDRPQDMRDFVEGISDYAHGLDPAFLVIPHGGVELVTTNGKTTGDTDTRYVSAINGLAQDSVFYGFNGLDQATPDNESERLRTYLDIARNEGRAVIMVTDYASSTANIDDSYQKNFDAGYISFAADNFGRDNIPRYPDVPYRFNRRDIRKFSDANNFLILVDTALYSTPQELVDAISASNYDLVVLDYDFNGEPYTSDQIRQMRVKGDGGDRLLIAAIDIGHADSDRYYWQSQWVSNPPEWLGDPLASTSTDYRVNYWLRGWQDIIYGDNNSFIYRLINAGYDGVYLEGVDVVDDF
ncbi:hypothetical protein [Microbulbifer sp. SAOS-129_SWC]|uniref:hypothetical protein n=1 Tax=Microbulbifer sp. SAOS-129_SWC TaxID=3145235 RepID=UPI0032169DCC